MSFAAHEFELYVIQKHLGLRVAFIPLIIGNYLPDTVTKPLVYGVRLFGDTYKAADPVQFHRGWPGVGFTHSLLFGVLVALVVFALTRDRRVSLSLLIGQWAHCFSDIGDSLGVMLFFPFSTMHVTVNAWAYASTLGHFVDSAAYFSGLGFVWDAMWFGLVLANWRVLTPTYFRSMVASQDRIWPTANRLLPFPILLLGYWYFFVWGTGRWIFWFSWAHIYHSFPFDLSWGGPFWAQGLH